MFNLLLQFTKYSFSFCLTKIVSITSESLEKAFAGIDTLVYVASKTYSVFDRVGELENVLAAMKTISCSDELCFVRRFCRSDGHNSS